MLIRDFKEEKWPRATSHPRTSRPAPAKKNFQLIKRLPRLERWVFIAAGSGGSQ
jgi:hypothetical protein